METSLPISFLLSLLKDSDPKIRTLAAAALAAQGDPRLLQNLGTLLEDKSPTFDRITGLPDVDFMRPTYDSQTVTSAVLDLVEKRDKADFDQYWAKHAGREYCAGWFLWQFRHGPFAGGPTFAPLAREQMLRIPSPNRELITLWIGTGPGERFPYSGYSESEVLAAAKGLGRDRVLAILRHQPPGSDLDITPNMQEGWGNQYAEMARFLLSHAKELLNPSDFNILLGLEEAEKNRANSWEPAYGPLWPVAAAALRPREQGTLILNEAEKRYPEAVEIPLAHWHISGLQALPEILRWFYRSPESEERLINAIERAELNIRYRPLAEAILASSDRSKIDGRAMFGIALLAREWKANFDDRFVDWIFSQPPDSDPHNNGLRGLVVRTSGVARKLVLDPRFLKADGQLLYYIEQSVLGSLTLTTPQATRLHQLIRGIDQGHPQSVPEPTLQEIRILLREGVGNQ